jgi:hypothetical protein
METRWNGLTCAIASNVATLTTTAGRTEAHQSSMDLAAGGIVVNLTANIAELFETDAVYTVIIRKET